VTDVTDRLLRLENVWVVALLLVAVLVALEARWRGDPRRGGIARAIRIAIRVGLGLLVAAIALFLLFAFFVLIVFGPIGP
jgi:O-antigen/teichoic acid export membrane protein